MAGNYVIHDVAIFDGEQLLDGRHTVVIDAGRIADILPAGAVPASLLEEARSSGRLVAGEGRTLLPGLIDLHVHLTWSAGADPVATLALETPEQTLLRSVGHGLAQRDAGITTVRDLGSPHDLAIRLSEAVAAGWVPGPRIIASGRTLIMTGGHDPFWGLMVDGPAEALKGVRTQLFAGAQVIKVSATGGVYGRAAGEAVDDVELLPEELAIITQQAHRRGVKVAAHAIGEEGITNCLDAGIDTIEHGHFLTREQAKRMADAGTILVPTLFVYQQVAGADGVPEYASAKARAIVERHREAVAIARDAGVRIGAGSDAGSPGTPHPSLLKEIECLVGAGLPPTEALAAATSIAAEALGLEGEIGRVCAGLAADLILVEGDPTASVAALRHVTHVWQQGRLTVRPM
ncbi:amidohydrolase family protein [Sphaerobacter sp.]|uniref:metal-dependent hydrolase family protein n=1 Tax=Sphaerobacter sp. TaxID=2099654 RepID=UPI001D88EFF7|nr:amidohydrolase family protein [Sphaerobacter sp.]MBX5445754.1 amidohydrolase family protein [Sphaerobacter sp.]